MSTSLLPESARFRFTSPIIKLNPLPMSKASIWGKIVAVSISVSFSAQADVLVRESIQDVQFSKAAREPAVTVSSGALLREAGVLETGEKGLVHIVLNKATVRMGSKTALRLEKDEKLSLVHGNVLFEGIAKQRPLSATLGGAPVSLHGEAGFVQSRQAVSSGLPSLTVGSMAGKTKVGFKGKTHTLKPGEFLSLAANGALNRGHFDLEKQVAESRLVNGFRAPLSGASKLRKQARQYAQLKKRGFIQEAEPSILAGQLDENGPLLAGGPTFKEKVIVFTTAPLPIPTPNGNGSAPPSSGGYSGSYSVSMYRSGYGNIPSVRIYVPQTHTGPSIPQPPLPPLLGGGQTQNPPLPPPPPGPSGSNHSQPPASGLRAGHNHGAK